MMKYFGHFQAYNYQAHKQCSINTFLNNHNKAVSVIKTYFMNIALKDCVVENIDATVFATNDYQSVLEDIKNIFKKVK